MKKAGEVVYSEGNTREPKESSTGNSSVIPDGKMASTCTVKDIQDWIWKKADQGMKTFKATRDLIQKRIKKDQSASSNQHSVQNITGTTSVLCAGRESDNLGQKKDMLRNETCHTKGYEICNLIWKRADQGMKTWIKAIDWRTKTAVQKGVIVASGPRKIAIPGLVKHLQRRQ